MTSLNTMLKTSVDLGALGTDKYRQNFYVLSKVVEEISEIQEEIKEKQLGYAEGKDGISGEAVDLLINLVDLYSLQLSGTKGVADIEKDIISTLGYSFEDYLGMTFLTDNEAMEATNGFMQDIVLNQQEISINCQVAEGLSYKSRTVEDFKGTLVDTMKAALNIFFLSFDIDADDKEEVKKIVEVFQKTVFKKVNKWRKIRSLPLMIED